MNKRLYLGISWLELSKNINDIYKDIKEDIETRFHTTNSKLDNPFKW